MKKSILLIVAAVMAFGLNAQEKNGTVYINHPTIEKTKQLWSAFEKGDADTYASLLSDSMVVLYNGSRDVQQKEAHVNGLSWWAEEFDGLKVVNDDPAFPDAIVYSKGGTWVQDWLLITGIHKKTGINLELHLHNLYSFNDEGKITSLHMYFNNNQFEDIRDAQKTKENGKVFINHPYIATVRKLVNAYCNEDINGMAEFYTDKARFSNAAMKWGESIDLEAREKELAGSFEGMDHIKMKQVGYPDCIYYEESDGYVVFSWWIFSGESTENNQSFEFPLMLSHSFDEDGKIAFEMAYFSSNHFE